MLAGICYIVVMVKERKIIIDLDTLSSDPEVLGKLYECGSLLVQSNEKKDAQLGYQMLEIVSDVMEQNNQKTSK
ncbi:MAG: hypothetical protein R8M46_00065 [Ghiorsea sp.]